jgi:pilus assembly protein FimV
MKVRKLAVALALAGGLGSGVAQALGLGEVELQSFLNEPLDADIALTKTKGVDRENIIAELASPEAFERLGLRRDYFLNNLDFSVETAPNGELVVNVTSREPVREPYLNFLVEVTWPNGRLLREYSVLVDPPIYAEESGLRDQVRAPQQTAAQPEPERARQPQRQRQQQQQGPDAGGNQRLGPTGPSDTLWSIAAQARPGNQVTMQQTMLALQDLNPDAFLNGNINRLKQGQVLQVPTLDQIRQRTASEAVREVQAQNQALAEQRQAPATREQAGTAAAGATEQGGDELRLIAGNENETPEARESGSAGGTGTGGVDAGEAVAREELDRARRQNEELSSRLEDMEAQVDTLRRLLELKNSQLAEMQQEAAQEDAPADQPEVTDATEPDAQQVPQAIDQDAPGVVSAEEPVVGQSRSPEAVREALEQSDAAEPDAQEPVVADEQPPVAVEPEAPQQESKGFVATTVDTVMSNPAYQIGLGGGLVGLLALLLLLSRRKARSEAEHSDHGEAAAASDEEDFTLTMAGYEEPAAAAESNDPLAEADEYIAYGRFDQAAQQLESAISREPSRSDLRLKLLGVYADSQDRDAFEKQLGELEALEDADAIAEAEALQARLQDEESMPSIDDLESQLRSGSPETDDSWSYSEPDDDTEEEPFSFGTDFESENEKTATTGTERSDQEDFDSSLEDLELDEKSLFGEDDITEAGANEDESIEDESDDDAEADLDALSIDDLVETETGPDKEVGEASEKEVEDLSREIESSSEPDDFSIDFETDTELDEALEPEPLGAELPAEPETGEPDEPADAGRLAEEAPTAEKPLELEEEFASLDADEADIDSAETGDEADRKQPAAIDEDDWASSEEGSIDESFLDELDAELEKFSEDDDADDSSSASDSSMDDLELDVSDEDLSLISEFADSDSKDEGGEQDLEEPIGIEEGLDDALDDAEVTDSIEAVDETTGHDPELDEVPVVGANEPDVNENAAEKPPAKPSEVPDIEESDLGDEDDFDFLAGTDEIATKLDLARAYVEMGDADGARSILDEVTVEGDEQQKAEAEDMLKNLP